MFRLYSKGCEYTIRALSQMEPTDGGGHCVAAKVCRKAGIPESFTRKIFQGLVQGGFLKAVTGPGGGYTLTRNPKDISVLSIIEAVDGYNVFEGCVMGLPQCGNRRTCALHPAWKAVRDHLISSLRFLTLEDLMKTVTNRPIRSARGAQQLTSRTRT